MWTTMKLKKVPSSKLLIWRAKWRKSSNSLSLCHAGLVNLDGSIKRLARSASTWTPPSRSIQSAVLARSKHILNWSRHISQLKLSHHRRRPSRRRSTDSRTGLRTQTSFTSRWISSPREASTSQPTQEKWLFLTKWWLRIEYVEFALPLNQNGM